MALPTLLDIAKRNGHDAVVGLIDEASRQTPELTGRIFFRGQEKTLPNVGSSRTIKGRQYKTLVRTGLPTAGFRDANEGVAASVSTFENRLVETFILNPRWECDKAVADSSEDGPEAYIADEAIAIVTAGLMAFAKQFYYGAASGVGHAKGGPGLLDSVHSDMVVDAAGTTANAGSSVWAVKYGPKNVQLVYGDEGMMEVGEVRIESIVSSGSNRFSAYVQELLAYPGVQVGSIYSIGRIKKLTEEAGKKLTDTMMGSLLSKFPVGFEPDVFFMSRRSAEQLRSSRTATNPSGSEAPTPSEYEGIPIVVTDSIRTDEALTL